MGYYSYPKGGYVFHFRVSVQDSFNCRHSSTYTLKERKEQGNQGFLLRPDWPVAAYSSHSSSIGSRPDLEQTASVGAGFQMVCAGFVDTSARLETSSCGLPGI